MNKADISNRISLTLLSCILLASALITFQDFGITFDEPRQQDYSEMSYQFYATSGQDDSAFHYYNMRYYGAGFELLCAVANRISPWGIYETRHLVNGFVGALGIIGTYQLAVLLGGGWISGLLAALMLTFTPSWFGHMFNNPKDIPFATGYIWVMYFLLKSCGTFPRISWKIGLGFALALGLTLGVRIGGVLLVGTAGLTALVYLIRPKWFIDLNDDRPSFNFGHRLGWLSISMGSVLVGAFVIMLLCWPWALTNPLQHPLEAIQKMSGFDDWPGTILLNGTYVDATNLPRSYIFRYFWVKLPELFIVILSVIPFISLFALSRKPRSPLTITRLSILFFGIVFPVSVAILKKSALYDGIRHFLFLLPLFSVACTVTLVWIFRRIKSPWLRLAAALPLFFIFVTQVKTFVILHPHQYVYYNRAAGGLAGAENFYELDYWANSYREAVRKLETITKKRDGEEASRKTYKIFVDGPYLSATYYFPTNFVQVMSAEEADFAFGHTRWDIDKNLPGQRIDAVQRYGVNLTVINEMHPDQTEAAEETGP